MEPKYPLITCVVLTYQKFQYIYIALESILMQNYPQIELIISDDASGNFPEKDIRLFIDENKKENLKNILIRKNEKNFGIVKNLNAAVREAKGEYIVGLSGDDKFYEISTMIKIIDKFIETGAEILSCRRAWCSEINLDVIKIVPSNRLIPDIKKMNTSQKQFKTLATRRYDEIFCGASLYYKRSFLKERGWFDESYKMVEDHIICLQYIRTGGTIVFADDIVSTYYREGGISTGQKRNLLLLKDDDKTYKTEIIPYMGALNKRDQRYIKFLSEIPIRYYDQPLMKKLSFIINYIDMCILSRFYKYSDQFRGI